MRWANLGGAAGQAGFAPGVFQRLCGCRMWFQFSRGEVFYVPVFGGMAVEQHGVTAFLCEEQ